MGALTQGLAHVRTLFREPLTPERALSAVRARMAEREASFLATLQAGVFGRADNPFRPLLDAASYDLPRIRDAVARVGLEEALQRMAREGVYVAIEEFKGRRPIQRGSLRLSVREDDFTNPLARGGLRASSGGTSTAPTSSTILPSHHRMGAEHLTLALAAYGAADLPAAVWLSRSHGAGFWAVLALSAGPAPKVHWFTSLASPPGAGRQIPRDQRAIHWWSALRGVRLPAPRHVPFGEESTLLTAMRRHAPDGYSLFTTASGALRLALASHQTGFDLRGVTFITVAEPLTAAKLASVQASGARAFSSLGFTEFGRATYGCAAAEGADDTHVCADAVAVTRRRRAVDTFGTELDALLFTTLRPDARRILLNVETGDYATPIARRCGCPLESAGWTNALREVRSYEKLNAEGRRFSGPEMIGLVEEVLPARFGGDATDYQIVEAEDRLGFTRLSVLVHPRLPNVDEDAVLATVETAFRRAHALGTQIWKEAGTLRLRRAPPYLTPAGKILPLHHLH